MSLRHLHHLALALIAIALFYLAVQMVQGQRTVMSRWALAFALESPEMAHALVGQTFPLAGFAQRQPAAAPAHERLVAFTQASTLVATEANGQVAYYRRSMSGGELAYVVAHLGPQVQIELLNADGATPTSDARGDTTWADGQAHLATVAEMVAAPYASREGLELLAAMDFGFHGAVRTSNEGSVVINGVIQRVNEGRSALCITPDQRVVIDRLSAETLKGCQQAIGGGPIILWQGRVANPAISVPSAEEVPFNPLGEDFVQLDWRLKIYSGTYPKTAACAGDLPSGTSFLILATSNGVSGIELARALRDMGCATALGGDDDTSTQLSWRGQSAWANQPNAVPDAIGVYVRR